MRIEDGILYFDAYSVTEDGAENVDSFAIQKDKTQGDIAEGYVPDDNTAEESKGADTIAKILSFLMKVITIVMNIAKWYVF